MPRVTYIEHNGVRHEIDVPVGHTVMEGAVNRMVPGIDGDCGGACACATCHVHVAPEWTAKLAPASELERDMLGFAQAPDANSRLACQITVTPDLDGLVVRMPESQY
jgi:2Fe-2S ferredoxin